ncbi:hypothetical protein AHAS_Ahas04G0267900 [Arachis hypogaea]
MGRPKEERYWNQVTKEAAGTWKCKRCGRQFSGGASRIKAHVDRIPGKGISICSASPDDNHLQPQSQETANPMNPREVAAEDDDHEMVDAFFGGLMPHSINIISQPINLPGGLVEEEERSSQYTERRTLLESSYKRGRRYVERWKCKRCGRQFSGGASRIKAHVDRIREKWPAAEDDDHGIVDASFGGLMDHSINITEPMNLDGR